MRIAVLGRGISGLAAGHYLQRAGHEVVSVDPAVAPGGLIRSERVDGFLCETGPQALLDGPADTRALSTAAGLDGRVVRASANARRRFIHADGRLNPLPMNPIALARSRLLDWRGKLRLLREPFIRNQPADEDESVLAFAARRFGEQVARAMVAPAVIGIYAGDAARLSARSALPRLVGFERARGSVIRGALAQRREQKAAGGAGKVISFPEGLQELARALDQLPGRRRVVARPTRIERAGGSWRVALDGGAGPIDADAVVFATPGHAAASLLEPLAPVAAAGLRDVPVASAVVVCLGFRGAGVAAGAPSGSSADLDIGVDLRAYGFLVARDDGASAATTTAARAPLLGCQYESSIFAGRAPAGGVLLRAILGGVFDPTIADESDGAIAALTIAELRRLAGLQRAPDFVRVWRHRDGIPQYNVGHAARVARIDSDLARYPGLHLLGHTLRGVGLNDCIAAGAALARQIP